MALGSGLKAQGSGLWAQDGSGLWALGRELWTKQGSGLNEALGTVLWGQQGSGLKAAGSGLKKALGTGLWVLGVLRHPADGWDGELARWEGAGGERDMKERCVLAASCCLKEVGDAAKGGGERRESGRIGDECGSGVGTGPTQWLSGGCGCGIGCNCDWLGEWLWL